MPPAQTRQRLQLDRIELGARDTVLLLGDPRLLTAREVDHLLDWVSTGGHLVVPTPPGRRVPTLRADELLTLLNLAEFADRHPATLSG